MKRTIFIIAILLSFNSFSQSPQPTGTRYNNATKIDTISGKTRIPVLDANNVLNKYTIIDSLPLNAPLTTNPDSLLIYTPQKRAAHIPYTDFLQKLKTSLDTIYNVTETDPIFTAWDKDYNDLINTPVYSNFAFVAPYLHELVPDTYLPSTTGNFILRGSFFTPDMEITVEDHTINYQTFVSSNEFIVNLTTSATEGSYDVTLDNGLISVYPDQLQVVNGTVYQPLTPSDWNTVTLTDLSSAGQGKITTWNALHSANWNQEFDYTKNWIFSFKIKRSPLGNILSVNDGRLPHIVLKRITDDFSMLEIAPFVESGNLFKIDNKSNIDAWATSFSFSPATTDLIESYSIEIKHITGVLYLYVNNVLRRTYTNTLATNLYLTLRQKSYDIVDIKYIDLSDTGGGYIDPDKLISQFTNDIGYLEDAPSDGNEYVRKDGDWEVATGGGSDDQTASEVPFTPYETISSTNVQDAIEELKDELDALPSIPTSLAAANITVSPAIGGNTDAYAVMDDHEDRITALEAKAAVLTGTGTAINMSNRSQYNFGAASSASTFTMTNIAVGGYAEVLINKSGTAPTVTGATQLPNTAAFVQDTDMVLCIKDFNGTRKFWFVEF